MKKILLLLLCILLAFSLVACSDLDEGEDNETEEEGKKPEDNAPVCRHEDLNHDGICDISTCLASGLTVNHIDYNHDGKCDVFSCSVTGLAVVHVDAAMDGICDVCGAPANGGGNNTGNTPGGNTGNEGGNTGNEGGNTGNEGGNTGNEGGNTGNEGGNTGNEGGTTTPIICLFHKDSNNDGKCDKCGKRVGESGKTLDEVLKAGKLVVATSPDFPPFQYLEDGEIVGIDTDIMQIICKHLGVELVLEEVSFETIIPGIEAHKYDAGISGIPVTDERKEKVIFTDVYYESNLVVVVRSDSDITSKDELYELKISAMASTTAEWVCLEEYGYNVSLFGSNQDAMLELISGYADAWVVDYRTAKEMCEGNYSVKILDEVLYSEEYAFAFAFGSEDLVEEINRILNDLINDGTIAEIFAAYGEPYSAPGDIGNGSESSCKHVDFNHDGDCDYCKEFVPINHYDYNSDCICDAIECLKSIDHVDLDKDYSCDVCGTIYEHECEDLDCDGLCDYCYEELIYVCDQCIDKDGDSECDLCGYYVNCDHDFGYDGKGKECYYCQAPNPGYGKEEEIVYPWDSTTLIMEISENTNNQELLSVSKKYLAGKDDTATDEIATSVRKRNSLAEIKTKTTITYKYLPDTGDYAWGQNVERIVLDVKKGGSDATDIYCNFVYDMVGASLKQCFANVLAENLNANRGENYFEFLDADYNAAKDDRGYMYEYMTSLTLAPTKKMYILASDYFIDMVRAFFCIPVSISIMESQGADVVAQDEAGNILSTGADRDGSGEYDIDDFYQLVKDGEWTYNTLAKFAAKVYKPSATNDGTCKISDDVVGFAMATGGLAASGLLYTTSVEIIKKTDLGNGKYDYTYPADNQDFYAFCDATTTLFGSSKGVCIVDKDYTQYGDSSLKAIRKRFSQDKVLFGDIMLVGALEFNEYQDMKESAGFGVVPVPLYRSGSDDKYLTQIHNVGNCGAISIITKKFSQCTAFLNYQSTNSEDILNDYYKYKLQHDIAGGSTGTVEMLQYIRDNVRSSFDKAMEDALGVFNTEASKTKWHSVLAGYKFQVDIRSEYQSTYGSKEKYLDDLANAFLTFPD